MSLTMTYFLNRTVFFYIQLLATIWSFYTLAFILTTMGVYSDAYNHQIYYIRNHTFDDVHVTDEEIAYFETKSELICFMSCVNSPQCKSISYNEICSVCQHFTVAFWAKSLSGINQSGWIHYDPPSCEDLFKANYGSGIYTIYPHQLNGLRVKCEMDVDGGRWTVIQQRFDGSVDFKRSWEEYKTGFGDIRGEFWIGNEHLHVLTSSWNNELRVDMSDWHGNSWYAVYKTFKVDDENSQYKLTVGNYSGNAGDSMAYHTGMNFSTTDRDNDLSEMNCAKEGGGNGGWWYNACDQANLNSLYGEDIGETTGIEWESVLGRGIHTMKITRMMIRQL